MTKRVWFAILLVFVLAFAADAARRRVLMEGFTNIGCPYCPAADATSEAVMLDYGRDAVLLMRYHTWWPNSNDPFYTYNTSENTARINYYSVNSVPKLKVDGVLTPTAGDYYAITGAINSRQAIDSPCDIEVTTEIVGNDVEVEVLVIADTDMHLSYTRLFVALIHDCYAYGGTKWYPFRDMEPSTSGLTFTLDAGDTLTYTTTFSPYYQWNYNNLSVIAFVQRYTTKEVFQSGWAYVGEPNVKLLVNEVMTANQTVIQDPAGDYDPWVEIYNPGPDDVDLAGLHLTNNWAHPDLWTFPTQMLPAGDHVIVWCDGETGEPGLHANFTLTPSEGYIGIYGDLSACHDIVDELLIPHINRDISHGRQCDGSSVWVDFQTPTPEATNSGCFDNVEGLVVKVDVNDMQLFWQTVDWAVSYTVYRHGEYPFNPSSADSITTVVDTFYVDSGIVPLDPGTFYRVTARPY